MSVLPTPDFGLLGQDGCVVRPDWLARRRRRVCPHPGLSATVDNQDIESFSCSHCGEMWQRKYGTLIVVEPRVLC